MAELRFDADWLHDYRMDKEAERRNKSKRIQLNEDLAKWLAKGHEITVLEALKPVLRQPCKKLMPMPKASKDKTPYFNREFNKKLREWCFISHTRIGKVYQFITGKHYPSQARQDSCTC